MSPDRVTTTLAEDTSFLLDGAVESGLYTNRGDGVRSALREYFDSNPDVALASAIRMYEKKEKVTLVTAARLADKSPSEMQRILSEAGVLDTTDA